MPEPVPTPHHHQMTSKKCGGLQIEKLRLEVQSLVSQRRKESITQLLPLVSTCIANWRSLGHSEPVLSCLVGRSHNRSPKKLVDTDVE